MSRKLTTRFVETAKSTGARTEIRDEAVPGLELRISPRGAKTWALRYRRKSDGLKRTVTLGAYPTFSLEEAREWAGDKKREIAKGEDPAGKHRALKDGFTFKELSDEWLALHGASNVRERALGDYRSMLTRHVLPEIGAMKAVEVRKRDVIALLDAVMAKGDARTLGNDVPRRMTHRPNRVFELVRAVFRWGVGRDLLQIDPTAGLKPPIKKEAARERVLANDEIRTLWSALTAAPNERRKLPKGSATGTRVVADSQVSMTANTALAIKLALVTGQRIGEVVGMAISELDLNETAPVWVIPGERTKNGEANRVPLSQLALKLVHLALLESMNPKFVFPSATDPAKSMGEHAPTKALQRSRSALGIDNFRIHDLRRTAATGIAELGYPNAVSLVLNHISVRRGTVTGRVYDQYSYDREKRQALDAWGLRLEQILAGGETANVIRLRPGTSS